MCHLLVRFLHGYPLKCWKPLLRIKPFGFHFRFQLYDLDRLLVDSGDVYNTRITGGRVGVYQFGQQMALFSDIWVHCLDRANKALKLDGGTYVMITEITKLSINKR